MTKRSSVPFTAVASCAAPPAPLQELDLLEDEAPVFKLVGPVRCTGPIRPRAFCCVSQLYLTLYFFGRSRRPNIRLALPASWKECVDECLCGCRRVTKVDRPSPLRTRFSLSRFPSTFGARRCLRSRRKDPATR